ncbi:Ig-like domain-containing protein [Methanobrevibacter sp.]|uniref:Ig-like domain-containing protein n=1 Tax=Methanobrevibacter sp. TaxID=66852 RepID=UPI003865A199
MKINKILVFAIAIVFLVSINFAVAVDENATHAVSEVDDNAVELQDAPQNSVADDSEDMISQDTSNDPEPVQTIKMGKVTKRYNGAIEYQATFYDANGNPLKNTEVYFEVDDSTDYSAVTDSNGVALLTILINNGNHKIAAFCTDPVGINYDNIKVFDVLRGNKNINMYYEGGNTYKVRVFDDNGQPAKAGKKVTFAIGKKVAYRYTDKNGYAQIKIHSTPGIYEIGAKYQNFIVKNYLTVKQVIKPLTSFKDRAIKSKIKFKVKLLGKNNKNKVIKVKFNKKTYKAKTNKKGIAKFYLKTPKKVGVYKVITSYKKTKVTSVYSKYYA